jgi:type I restriction-modification system DNA methylase subunit
MPEVFYICQAEISGNPLGRIDFYYFLSMAPPSISTLVQRFQDHRDSYTAPGYNEAQLRSEFLDPFFDALGWDVYNRQGYAEAYKEVIHEDAVKVGTATKAPDYSFRIGGVRKFFVEAKKPSVSIKDDPSPAFQLRRYAWSAKLPLSILSNFEEFAVYDCRQKPDKNDKASVGRILSITCDEYETRWEEIASLFTKEAILKGSFDKFARGARRGKGTAQVDDAFLADIEKWRIDLAKNIAIRNPGLSTRQVNFAVQRTIDRLIFLRICEDRGIEDYGKLQAHLNGERIYERFCAVFREADDRYNSGLFHFREEKDRGEAPDTVTLALLIDDKILREIVSGLYYPESPYEFSVLPADILGQVYEQFLGKVIRLTAGHQAKVEDKPEVRKAGGVFYTPTYIVDYIVKNTVGKLLDPPPLPPLIKGGASGGGISPREASKLRILDPACGSGSFLIGAYQFLLDWHRDWYLKNEPEKWTNGKNAALYKTGIGEYRLTTPERKRILLNNIYGVDIDTQAVEVTKLSLLLKVLEGETEQTIAQQLKLFHTRALPDLGNNIKCGNSLIGSDFYEGAQESLALYEDEEEKIRINAFDWDGKDGFPEIMKAGGFDAVIGNPPYVRQETLGEKFKDYAAGKFKTYAGTADLYVYFFERGVNLLNDRGLFSFIVANKWMRTNYGESLRRWMKEQTIHEIVDFGDLPVFQNATTYTCITTLSKRREKKTTVICKVETLEFKNLSDYVKQTSFQIDRESLKAERWSLADAKSTGLLEKIKSGGTPLGEYVKGQIFRGVVTGLNEAFVIDEETKKRLIKEDRNCGEIIKPFLAGKDIKRYKMPNSNRYLIFTQHGITIKNYPAIEKYLLPYKERLMPKPANWKGNKWNGRKPGLYKWYEIQDTIDYSDEFEKTKILWPGISSEVASFTIDERGYYGNDNNQLIISSDKYLLGILNSKLMRYYLTNICDKVQGGFYRLKIIYIEVLPVKALDISSPSDKTYYNKLVSLVSSMLDLNKKLPFARDDQEKTLLARQIDSTDRQIDKLVYELYGLTEEEIKIVEGGK